MKDKSLIEIDRIIEMAWEDRTPFEAIFNQFEINEKQLIGLMRNNLKKVVLNYGERELVEEKLNIQS